MNFLYFIFKLKLFTATITPIKQFGFYQDDLCSTIKNRKVITYLNVIITLFFS